MAYTLADLTLPAMRAAADRIQPYLRHTPLAPSATLSRELGAPVFLKCEMLQKTGSFKARGAFNTMLQLPPGSRVVAVSGGNHAQGVAYAATVLGMQARIYMPSLTPPHYLAATRAYGAEIILVENIHNAFEQVAECQAQGWELVHPFDDPRVIAGQATVALELLADLPDVTDVVVSIGGGGLMTGVAAAVKALRPQARVWGVETVGADAMSLALAAGHPVMLEKVTSIARTLGAPSVSAVTLQAAQTWLEQVEVVSDRETFAALEFLLERTKLLTEPAAACTWVAAQHLRGQFHPRSQVALILCGGNVGAADLCAWRSQFPV